VSTHQTYTISHTAANIQHTLHKGLRPLNLPKTPHRRDLIVSDISLLNISFIAAALITFGEHVFFWSLWQIGLSFLAINLTWCIAAIYKQMYRWYERRLLNDEVFNTLGVIVVHFAVITMLYYNSGLLEIQRSFLIYAYLMTFFFITTARILNRRSAGKFIQPFNYIIVGGKPSNINKLTHGFDYAFRGKANLLGRFGNTPQDDVPTIGRYEDLRPYLLSNNNIQKVIFIYSGLEPEQETEIVRICQMRFIDLEVMPSEVNFLPRGFKVQRHGDTSILTGTEEPLTRLINKIVKRTFDIVFSLFVIVFLLSWLIPIVALIIKLDSKGPIFFSQERSGYMNQRFNMLKFRTMTVNTDCDSVQAKRGDCRITKVGAFLRKTSIDELPQFFNVLWGTMSVVGPRPHMLQHTKEYSDLIQHYLVRHKIKPGITGWAQIHGLRGPTQEDLGLMRERVEYDVWYLDNWSIFLDFKCIFQTVFNVFQGEENAC